MRRYRKFLYFLLSCVVVLALSCRFEICVGGFADAALLNGLDKLRGAFREADYADLLMLAAVMWMFGAVEARDRKFDVGTGLLSFVFAVLLVVCISFRKFNSAVFLLGNSFQILLSLCCIAGFWILLYLALRLVFLFFEKERPSQEMPAERTAGQGFSYFGSRRCFWRRFGSKAGNGSGWRRKPSAFPFSRRPDMSASTGMR